MINKIKTSLALFVLLGMIFVLVQSGRTYDNNPVKVWEGLMENNMTASIDR